MVAKSPSQIHRTLAPIPVLLLIHSVTRGPSVLIFKMGIHLFVQLSGLYCAPTMSQASCSAFSVYYV